MSSACDTYKEEAIRYLWTPELIHAIIQRRVSALCGTFVPGVQATVNEGHYATRDRLAITVAGSVEVVEDRPWRADDPTWDDRKRRQNRWVCRKLREYGEFLEADPVRVSTCNGTVYFSYHIVVEQVSRLV